MGFITSTTFNQVFFRHCIIIIQCVFILLLLESRRHLLTENRENQRGFWVRPTLKATGKHTDFIVAVLFKNFPWGSRNSMSGKLLKLGRSLAKIQ